MRRTLIPGALFLAISASSGCLVLSVQPAYDNETLAWEPALVGTWMDQDDGVSVQVERGEWRSYRIHYTHPIETGDLMGYATRIGEELYLDVMPRRGEDRGSFVVPVHAVLLVGLEADRLEVTPLSYDWFSDRIRAGVRVPGISVVLDQKQNALIVSPAAQIRAWLKRLPAGGPAFGASAIFLRK